MSFYYFIQFEIIDINIQLGLYMRYYLNKKGLLFLLIFLTCIISMRVNANIRNESNPFNIKRSIQTDQSEWATNNSRLKVIIQQDLSLINAGQNYTLNSSIQSLFLSNNVSSISGLKLEIRFIYGSGLIDYKSISFNQITQTGVTENGSTDILVPQSIETSGDPNNHETIGTFIFNLHFYEFLNNNKINNFTSGWNLFSIVTIKNLTNPYGKLSVHKGLNNIRILYDGYSSNVQGFLAFDHKQQLKNCTWNLNDENVLKLITPGNNLVINLVTPGISW